jgi:predicted dehydrogenase
LSRVHADAALIATPSFLHAPQALQALDAGLAVLVEKPFGCNLEEAVQVVQHAQTAGRPVMVAENYRFFRAERTVRHLLDEGVAGRLRGAVCVDRRDQPSHTQGPWVKDLEHAFLKEIAVHHFDSFRYLFNRQPVSLFARSCNPTGSDYAHGAAAHALIRLEGDFALQYGGTFVANRYEYSLRVEGDRGDIWTDRRRVWWRRKGRRFFRPVRLVPVPKGDEQRYPKAGTVSLLDQFRDALLEGKEPETSGSSNLWTLAMLDAAVLSDREARVVGIDEVFTPALKAVAGTPSGDRSATGAAP